MTRRPLHDADRVISLHFVADSTDGSCNELSDHWFQIVVMNVQVAFVGEGVLLEAQHWNDLVVLLLRALQ